MATKDTGWSISEYLGHFEAEIGRAAEERFKEKFKALAGELELLDSEFMSKRMGCGGDLEKIIKEFHSLTGRLGYCERPRGFEKDCDALYMDVEKAIGAVHDFRQSCSK